MNDKKLEVKGKWYNRLDKLYILSVCYHHFTMMKSFKVIQDFEDGLSKEEIVYNPLTNWILELHWSEKSMISEGFEEYMANEQLKHFEEYQGFIKISEESEIFGSTTIHTFCTEVDNGRISSLRNEGHHYYHIILLELIKYSTGKLTKKVFVEKKEFENLVKKCFTKSMFNVNGDVSIFRKTLIEMEHFIDEILLNQI